MAVGAAAGPIGMLFSDAKLKEGRETQTQSEEDAARDAWNAAAARDASEALARQESAEVDLLIDDCGFEDILTGWPVSYGRIVNPKSWKIKVQVTVDYIIKSTGETDRDHTTVSVGPFSTAAWGSAGMTSAIHGGDSDLRCHVEILYTQN